MDENHHSTLLSKTGTLLFSSGCWPIWTRNNFPCWLDKHLLIYSLFCITHNFFFILFIFLRPRLNRLGTCWKCKWKVWVQVEGEFGDKSQSFEAGWKWWWRIEVKNDSRRIGMSTVFVTDNMETRVVGGGSERETEIERESTAKWRDQQVLTL